MKLSSVFSFLIVFVGYNYCFECPTADQISNYYTNKLNPRIPKRFRSNGDLSKTANEKNFSTFLQNCKDKLRRNENIDEIDSKNVFIEKIKNFLISGIRFSDNLLSDKISKERKQDFDKSFLKSSTKNAKYNSTKYKNGNEHQSELLKRQNSLINTIDSDEIPKQKYQNQSQYLKKNSVNNINNDDNSAPHFSNSFPSDKFVDYSNQDQLAELIKGGVDLIDRLFISDQHFGEEEFEFVEPMVFDLVRGLGAKVGESEANYLMIIPLNGEPVEFSPEYEVVYKYHQGFEVELPIEKGELDALKFAHQSTFTDERDFKDGFQVYAEFFQHKPEFELDMVYINAKRIGQESSNLMMVGTRTRVSFEGLDQVLRGHEKPEDVIYRVESGGIIINNSVFRRLKMDIVIGLEVLIYLDATSRESFIALYPQVHVPITETLTVQLGLGFLFEHKGFVPQFAYRVINESEIEEEI